MRTLILVILSVFFANFSSYASDTNENVAFPLISYPIEKIVDESEKINSIIYETPYSIQTAKKFNTILIQGETANLEIKVSVRLKKDEQNSYDLEPETYKIYRNGRFWAKFKTEEISDSFKVLFTNKAANKRFKLTIYEIQSTFQSVYPKTDAIPYEPSPSLSVPDTLPFKIVKRTEWEAAKPKEPYTEHTPKAITIHHTAGKKTENLDDSLAEIQFIQDYHQNGRGWIDIGYHFLVDSKGNIFEGRPIMVVGAHVYKRNTNNIGISVMGNYHPPKNDTVSEQTISAITTISQYVSDTYSVKKSSFYAHRDIGATDCPGDVLYSKMTDLKNLIFNKETLNIEIPEIPVPDTFNFGYEDKKALKTLIEISKTSKIIKN